MIDNLKELWGNYPDIKFCRVMGRTKKPFEKDWPNKHYSFDEINTFVENGENYGVLAGPGDLVIIDSDEPEVYEKVKDMLPETLTVKTGKGHHSYFFCDGIKEKIILTAHDKHWGEVQSYGTMVVGPGSTHPSGSKYEVLLTRAEKGSGKTSHPIATITHPQLLSAIKSFDKSFVEAEKAALFEQNNYDFDNVDIDQIKITDVWEPAGTVKDGKDGEVYGEHPVHGSSTGMNFFMNPGKNTWKCFRCNSGGGALSAIAVKYGIMDCSECVPGALRDEKVKQAIEIAKDNGWGVVEDLSFQPQTFSQIADPDFVKEQIQKKERPKPKEVELLVRQFGDFKNLKKDTSFFVKDFILPKTVTMLYSPPGQFKSFLALYLAMCVANGKDWLGLETKENSVLYLDGENNDQILKDRLEKLYLGHNFEKEEFPLYIIKRGTLMDNKKNIHLGWLNALAKVIRQKKTKILFIDTLHRYCGYDENSSDDINKLYTDIFQPLIEEFGISIVFLHHSSKAGGYRGSGDFLGMVDTAYSVSRITSRPGEAVSGFTFKNEKNRAGEQELITGQIEFGENDIKIVPTKISRTEDQKVFDNAAKEMEDIVSVFEKHILLRKADIIAKLEAVGVEIADRTLTRRLKELVDSGKIIYNKGERGYEIFFWEKQEVL